MARPTKSAAAVSAPAAPVPDLTAMIAAAVAQAMAAALPAAAPAPAPAPEPEPAPDRAARMAAANARAAARPPVRRLGESPEGTVTVQLLYTRGRPSTNYPEGCPGLVVHAPLPGGGTVRLAAYSPKFERYESTLEHAPTKGEA